MNGCVVLGMPEEKKQIGILNRMYLVDITNFTVLNRIKALPCMAERFIPTEEQATTLIEQFQEIFTEVLGEALPLPDVPPVVAYFRLRYFIVQLYNLILEEQGKYLELEYPVRKNTKDTTDKMLEITRNLSKIYAGKNVGEENNK